MSIFNCTCKSTNCDLLQLINEDGFISIEKSGDYVYKLNLHNLPTGSTSSIYADTPTINFEGFGTISSPTTANVKISAISGNRISQEADGIAVLGGGGSGTETPNNAIDSDTVDLTVSGPFNRTIKADVKISAQVNNALSVFPDGIYSTNTVFTQANARNSVNATAPLLYDNSTGIFSIATATTSTTGALTSTDWNTFNNKQATITWNNITAGSNKVALGGTPIGAVKNAVSIDINEGNFNLANLGGVLPALKGGTGLSALGTSLQVLRMNSGATALEFATLSGAGAVTSVFTRTGDVVASSGDYDTLKVTENTNLYFTTARARTSISAGAGISYNNSTGVISSSIDGSETKISNGTNITMSGTGTIADPYVINAVIGGGGGGAENPLTFTTPLQRSGDVISILQSGTGSNGYLSSTDYNKFNDNLQLRTTIASLRANASPSTTIPYYIVDAGQEGFFAYAAGDTTTAEDGGNTSGTYHSGTVLISADGKRFKRIYNGPKNLRWYGGKADYAPSGSTMTGTDNTAPFNRLMTSALDKEPLLIPYGNWYFASKPNNLTDSKTIVLTIEGNTFHNGVGFLRADTSSTKLHKIKHMGSAIGKLNIPANSKAIYDAGTGPDWNSFTGYFIDVEDAFRGEYELTYVEGFKAAIRLAGGAAGPEGGQENRFKFNLLRNNKYGLLFESLDGSSYMDKNYFLGGRIIGDVAMYFNGNMAGSSKTGVFTANKFENILVEFCNSGIIVDAGFQFNSFIGCSIEGGINTGVFGTDKIVMNTNGLSGNNSFVGNEYFYDEWLTTLGRHTTIVGTPIFHTTGGSGAVYLGSYTLGGVSNGRVTILGTEGLAAATKAALPANLDIITLLGHHVTTPKPEEFAYVKLNGVEQTVSFEGKVVSITAGGTYTLTPPTGYIRIAPADNSAVVLVMERTQVQSGKWFWIEMVSTGTVQIIRSDDSSVALATTQITSPGYYFCRYFNAGAFTIVATKLGGGAGSLTLANVGNAPNAAAATIVSSVLTLQPADATNPGIITVGDQIIPGRKQFNPVVTTAPSRGMGIFPNITATADFALMFGVDINPTFNTGGFASTAGYGVRTPSIYYATTGTMNVASTVTANGLLYTGIGSTLPTTSFVNYSFSSGYTNKDLYLMIAKSGQTTLGMANDGTNMILATEKTTNGFIFRKNIGFSPIEFTGAFTGINLAQIFASGNMLLQTGGTYTDNGYKLDVQGTARFTNVVSLGTLASDPVSGANGQLYYNTASGTFRGYKAGAWADLGTGGGGGGGTGDASTNTSISVVNELVLFADTTGKLLKRSVGNGLIRLTSGVVSSSALVNLATEVSGQLAIANIAATGTIGTATKFLRDDAQWAVPPGGGGGGGITSVVNFGGTANANGLIISGATIQMNPASSTQPGGVSTGSQGFGGIKTFAGTIITRASLSGVGNNNTAPIKITAGSLMTASEVGALEHVGDSLWFTNSLNDRYKLATSDNNLVFVNKQWHGQYIEYNYGGRDQWEDGTPTFVVGAAAGTGPTVIFDAKNTNAYGEIRILAGTSPSINATAITVNFSAAAVDGCIVVLSAANSVAAGKVATVWAVENGTTGFTIQVGGTSLTSGSTHIWNYMVKRVL